MPHISKTCLYNFDPLKPHFYTVKLGFTGVYIISFISAQKHRFWVLFRTASKGVLTSTHNLYFEQKFENYQNILSEHFPFLVVTFSLCLNRHVFLNYFAHAFGAQSVAIRKISTRSNEIHARLELWILQCVR